MPPALELFFLIQQTVSPELLSQIPWWLQVPIYLFGFGGFYKFLQWVNSFRKRTDQRDQQEHDQAKELREELRKDFQGRFDYLQKMLEEERKSQEEMRAQMKELTEEVRKLEKWCGELVWVAKQERRNLRRALMDWGDEREDCGMERKPDERREKYFTDHFDKALEKFPFGDLRSQVLIARNPKKGDDAE